jgi:hypothetical protein
MLERSQGGLGKLGVYSLLNAELSKESRLIEDDNSSNFEQRWVLHNHSTYLGRSYRSVLVGQSNHVQCDSNGTQNYLNSLILLFRASLALTISPPTLISSLQTQK